MTEQTATLTAPWFTERYGIGWPEAIVTVDTAKGSATMHGHVHVAMTTENHVSITTSMDYGHRDQETGITYRGQSYSAHVHLYRQTDGSWTEGEDSVRTTVRRADFTNAPRTYDAAIRTAIAETVRPLLTDDVRRAAQANDVRRALDSIATELGELDSKRAELLARRDALAERLTRGV